MLLIQDVQKAALARETIFDDIWCVFFSPFLGGQQLWFLVTKPTISLVGSWASPYHLHLDHLSDQICQRRPESGEDQLGARHAVGNGWEWHKALCVLNAFEAHPHLHHYEACFVYSLAHTWLTWLCLWLMIFTIKGSFLYQIRGLMSEKRFLPRGVLGRKNGIGVASDWGWVLSCSNSDSLYGHIPATPCYSPILSSPKREMSAFFLHALPWTLGPTS